MRYPTATRASLSSPEVPATLTLTFAELDAASNVLARSLGVKKGDRVAVSLGNVAEHAVLAYAVFKLGAVLVPLNPGFNAAQVAAALSHLAVEVLVIAAATDLAYKPCRGRSNLDLLSALVPDLASAGFRGGRRRATVESPSAPTLRSVVVVDNREWHPEVRFPLEELRALTPFKELLSHPLHPQGVSRSRTQEARPVEPDAPLSPGETINIQFTSGTTSRPKAAMLTHGNILNNGRLIAARMGLEPADRVVCPPPLFHCFGSVLGLMATATTGASILFPSPAFDPAAALRMAAERRATALYGVTTMFVAELELLSSDAAFADLLAKLSGGGAGAGAGGLAAHLRKGIVAGSSVPEALMRRLYGALGLRDLVICYGMTETSPVSAMTAPADPPAKRAASVGTAMPHTALKVVAAGDRARVLPRGARGELAVAGYLVMRGYWGDGEHARGDLVDEEDGEGRKRTWMYTGDEACLDDEGYVQITGRIKDLIIRGGENVHPLEVENCLLQHPLVQDASVVGVPDAKYGEAIAAFVIPHVAPASNGHGNSTGSRSGVARHGKRDSSSSEAEASGKHGRDAPPPPPPLSEDTLREWVAAKLSGHLVPRHVFWIDEYPKTASGKIQKFRLREMARELVASSPPPPPPPPPSS